MIGEDPTAPSSKTPRASVAASPAPNLGDLLFVPHNYEPNYAYPLVVLLHDPDRDEGRLAEMMPQLSRQNHVGLGLRPPSSGPDRGFDSDSHSDSETDARRDSDVEDDGAPRSWGGPFARFAARGAEGASGSGGGVESSPGLDLGELLLDLDADPLSALEDAIFGSIRQALRALHIHTERVFLMGRGEGAAVAFWLALRHPALFAGVVSIDGWIPEMPTPSWDWGAERLPSVFLLTREGVGDAGLCEANARFLHTLGLDVAWREYPASTRDACALRRMFWDIDSWLVERCAERV